jgi:hypothetical protein
MRNAGGSKSRVGDDERRALIFSGGWRSVFPANERRIHA